MTRILCLLALAILAVVPLNTPAAGADPLVVLVMDPLAAPLSCPCVKGYAQRDYDKLGAHLTKQLGRDVKVYYAETLAGLKKQTKAMPDLVIGKDSVVRHEMASANLKTTPLAALSGKDGKITQTGLIVVADKDPAITAADLAGYHIIFGVTEAEEKHKAALALLKDFKIAVPEKLETCLSCSDGATTVIDQSKQGKKIATVISSYAQPLLEGCGTIKKGDLRVVGETAPVPFIVAHLTGNAALHADLSKALLAVANDADLCKVLETKAGFVAIPRKDGGAPAPAPAPEEGKKK